MSVAGLRLPSEFVAVMRFELGPCGLVFLATSERVACYCFQIRREHLCLVGEIGSKPPASVVQTKSQRCA